MSNLKRFLYAGSIESASGTQTFYIDAETQEEADARAKKHDTDGIHTEEVMVDDLGKLGHCGETTVDDFGDFPEISDTQRLEFMITHGAYIAWSKDHECCRVFQPDHDGDGPSPMTGWGVGLNWNTPREAIDAAIAHVKARDQK